MTAALGCEVFVVACCGAGGVVVGDLLGMAFLRGVIARLGIAAVVSL
jgi:hypothetical protein